MTSADETTAEPTPDTESVEPREDAERAPEEEQAHRAEAAPSIQDVEGLLRHAERVLYMRIGAGVVLYVIFAILTISAALTHTIQERAPLLLGLLIASIFALPRQLLKRELLVKLQGEVQKAWVKRMGRIQFWLASTRAIFFLGALLLFLGLPELVGAP